MDFTAFSSMCFFPSGHTFGDHFENFFAAKSNVMGNSSAELVLVKHMTQVIFNCTWSWQLCI